MQLLGVKCRKQIGELCNKKCMEYHSFIFTESKNNMSGNTILYTRTNIFTKFLECIIFLVKNNDIVDKRIMYTDLRRRNSGS